MLVSCVLVEVIDYDTSTDINPSYTTVVKMNYEG